MALRNIIEIDEEKCNGCGQCIVDCAEAALQIVNGKAKLVKEMYCDGLGACIGGCPTGALRIVQREADPFDEEATEKHVHKTKTTKEEFSACPGTRAVDFSQKAATDVSSEAGDTKPELTNWPIQLKLVPANASFLKDADLLLAADCAAFSTIHIHSRFIRGKILLIACPKLDDSKYYFEKLTELFKINPIKSITVLRMEVPCCGGLAYLVKEALKASGKDIPYKEVVIGIKGEILSKGKTPDVLRIQPA